MSTRTAVIICKHKWLRQATIHNMTLQRVVFLVTRAVFAGFLCFFVCVCVCFFAVNFRCLHLIGWRAANNHVLCSCVKYSWADDMVQVAKNEMWASEVCFACLTWLYGLFVRTLISLTNAYAGCGRPTLNFIERFWLGSVRSASKLNSKCTQMNYEVNFITMYRCTEMYSNVLQTARVHWRVPVLLTMKNRKIP